MVPPALADDDDRCAVCDRLWTAREQEEWIFLEVTRHTTDGRPCWTAEAFCSQEHAAAWLAQPLPKIEPVSPLPRTARDRLVDLGLVVAFGLPAILSCVGIVAIGKWLGWYG